MLAHERPWCSSRPHEDSMKTPLRPPRVGLRTRLHLGLHEEPTVDGPGMFSGKIRKRS